MRLVNEKNQYEQATGPEEDILHENIQFYTEIPVYTCIYKKEIKKSTLSVKNYMQEIWDKYSSLTATVSPEW